MIKHLCQFKAKDKEDGNIVYLDYEYKNNKYYWIASNGYRSMEYYHKSELINDVISLYGKWKGFKLLIEV